MEFFRRLNPAEIFEINRYTKENYDYSNVDKFFFNKQLDINFNA